MTSPAIVPKLWPGETVVCLGGGPSLTREDVEFCRGKARVIAINNAFQIAPWADVLYACDFAWWRVHAGAPSFQGLKFALTTSPRSSKRWPDVTVLKPTDGGGLDLNPKCLRTGVGKDMNGHGGFQAINLAVHLGAARILLLGYDMQRTQGKSHWHGNHVHPLHRDSPYVGFRRACETLMKPLQELGIEIVNCSRQTALTCFPKMAIDQALQAVAA